MNTQKIDRSSLWFGIGAVVALALCFAVAAVESGCKTLAPRSDVVVDFGGDAGPACPAGVTPLSPSADCNAKTAGDLECAVCATSTACIDYSTMVYCVSTCSDPACHATASAHKIK